MTFVTGPVKWRVLSDFLGVLGLDKGVTTVFVVASVLVRGF
jgi:hypothetical protein